VDIGRNLTLVEFGGFLRYVNVSRNFRLVGLSRFSRLWFRV
jgi:hypothetical protein